MKWTRLFYLIIASSLIIGVVIMFAVDLAIGALVIVADFAALGIVYIFFFKNLMKSERLVETGKPAQAKIMAMKDTGTIINDRYLQIDFTLEVYPEDGEPYEVETRGLVHLMQIPSFQPGSIFPVVVNPADPRDVAIGSKEEGEAGSTATTTLGDERRRQIEDMIERNEKGNQEILDKGKEAKAVILKAWDLDINVNGKNPAMQFLLEVMPEGQPAFQAQATGVIAEASVPNYQPGKTITVKYDPEDLSRVALFHSGPEQDA